MTGISIPARIALALLALAASATAPAAGDCAGSVVYVVRHTERASEEDKDSALSEAGERRAQALAALLAGQPIDAVYATHLRRTQQTVMPLAAAADRDIRVLHADDTAGLLRRLHEQRCGRSILVAGHSNTVPEILRGLGVAEPPTIASGDYGTLWAVRPGADGIASIDEQRFGDAP